MTDDDQFERTGILSVRDLQNWMKQELLDSAKAHELRSKDATEFVTAYAEGKITPEQAQEALVQHDRRWGEALPGAMAIPGASDEEIVRAIDGARDKQDEISSRISRYRTRLPNR
jgi:outer membrane translocation and assembly module TamA